MDFAYLLDAPSGDDTSWIQVAKSGKFSDPRYGNFTITVQDFAQWIRNFDANIGHGDLGLPVDVDHSPEKRGDTDAMGWVKQLEQRGNELWARVDWNGRGKELVSDKRYGYISPSYAGDFKDEHGKSHGTTLVGIALTNRPFLQMATVNLSRFTFAQGGGDDQGLNADDITNLDDMDFSDACNGGGTPDGYTDGHALGDTMLDISDAARQKHAVVVKKIDGNTRHMFPIPPGDKRHARAALRLLPRAIKAGHITSQEAAAIRQRAAGALGHEAANAGATLSAAPQVLHGEWIDDAYSLDQMELDQIINAMGLSRETLGVAADADDNTVLAAVKAHNEKQAKPAEGTVILSQDRLNELVADAAAGKAAAEQLRVSRFEDAFNLAQSQGKVVLAQKETFREIYDNNADGAVKLLDGLQPVVNMTPQGSGAGVADLDPAAQTLASEYQDEVTPRAVDTHGLKVLARADQLELEHKISFEKALAMAENELGVAA